MKSIYSAFLIFLMTWSAQAQVIDTNWAHQYDRTSNTGRVQIVDLPNGNFLISQVSNYYEINSNGDSLDAFDLNPTWEATYDMAPLSDGVLFGGILSNHAAIAKMDSNRAIVWSTELPFNNGETHDVFIDGTDIYVCGKSGYSADFISKLTMNGDTVWNLELPQTTFTQLSDIIKLGDGNFLATGNLDDYPIAVKFNASGDTIWTYNETIFISFQKANAYERSNGEIVVICERHMVELNADGTKKSDKKFSNGQYMDIEVDGDTVYLFGAERPNPSGSEFLPAVQVRNLAFDSLGIFQFTKGIYPTASNQLNDAVRMKGGGYIAVGKIRDSVQVLNNTYNVFATQLDYDGPIGIQESSPLMDEYAVYPNPASDFISFEMNKRAVVKVYDMKGTLVLTRVVNAGTQSMDISDLESGCYVVQLADGRFSKLLKH